LVYFGRGVTTNKNGSVIVASAPEYSEGVSKGVDIVFELDTVNKVYNETSIIIPEAPIIPGITFSITRRIGSQLELNGEGDILVIGQSTHDPISIFDPPSDTFIWVYIKNKINNTWNLLQLIDGMIERTDLFGAGMDISADGNVIAVGNPRFTNGTANRYGAVQTYTKSIFGVQASFTATLNGVSLASLDGKYFVFTASPIYVFFIWYDSTGTTTAPSVLGAIGIRVDISGALPPLDNSVATLTRIQINGNISAVTATSASNVFTVTNTDVFSPNYSVKDVGTGFIFNQINIGATPNQYGTGAERIINVSSDTFFGDTVALNASGLIMAVGSRTSIYLYSRTTTTSNWTQTTMFNFGSTFDTRIDSLDINSRGNVVIAGMNQKGLENTHILANTNGVWKIKTYDILDGLDVYPNQFGISTRISGDGALAVVGAPYVQNSLIGVKWKWEMNTIGIILGGGAVEAPFYFIIQVADDFITRYVIWYKLADSMSAPPPHLPMIYDPAIYWKTIQVDARDYKSSNDNKMLVSRTINAINGSLLINSKVTAESAQGGDVMTVTSKLAGVFGGVYDSADIYTPAPYYPTTFTFTQTAVGGNPAQVGAIWTLG
jgi:hypothetical protein